MGLSLRAAPGWGRGWERATVSTGSLALWLLPRIWALLAGAPAGQRANYCLSGVLSLVG